MLSPHEFATLLLVRDAQDCLELDPVDLDTLVERGLVSLEDCTGGHRCPRVTTHGFAVLKAVGWRDEVPRQAQWQARAQGTQAL